jgi:hypothetical protein
MKQKTEVNVAAECKQMCDAGPGAGSKNMPRDAMRVLMDK